MISLPRERMDQLVKRFDMLEAQMAAGPAPEAYVKLASEYSELQDDGGQDPRAARGREARSPTSRRCSPTRRPTPRCGRWRRPRSRRSRSASRRCSATSSCCCCRKDAADDKNAILEIRAGTGGDEAALFAGDLFRMYERYAAAHGWKVEVVSASDGEVGGYKEIIAIDLGQGRVRAAEIRIRRAPRAARAGDRGQRAHPHLGGDRRRAAGGRGGRHRDQAGGHPHRHHARLRAPAASTSTPPIRRCASPICRPASW